MNWWPCFVCRSEALCKHREPELALFLLRSEPATALRLVAAARIPAGRARTAAAGPDVEQAEMFGLRRWAK